MGLYKKIKDEKGVISTYFNVSNVSFDYNINKIVISVKEYADISYRNTEKNNEKIKQEIDNLQKQANDLYINYNDNINQIEELENQIKTMNDNLTNNNNDLYIQIKNYEFILEDKKYSLEEFYTMLKTLDTFKDSKDI